MGPAERPGDARGGGIADDWNIVYLARPMNECCRDQSDIVADLLVCECRPACWTEGPQSTTNLAPRVSCLFGWLISTLAPSTRKPISLVPLPQSQETMLSAGGCDVLVDKQVMGGMNDQGFHNRGAGCTLYSGRLCDVIYGAGAGV
jgi:hypothetical protein